MIDWDLKRKWDNKAVFDCALKEGFEMGIAQGREITARRIAKELKNADFPFEKIAKFTKLSIEEIEKL